MERIENGRHYTVSGKVNTVIFIRANQMAYNGMVHGIDEVLLPQPPKFSPTQQPTPPPAMPPTLTPTSLLQHCSPAHIHMFSTFLVDHLGPRGHHQHTLLQPQEFLSLFAIFTCHRKSSSSSSHCHAPRPHLAQKVTRNRPIRTSQSQSGAPSSLDLMFAHAAALAKVCTLLPLQFSDSGRLLGGIISCISSMLADRHFDSSQRHDGS